MNIWRIANPRDYKFAQAAFRGTWKKSEKVCSECRRSEREQPLIIEWEPGSDVIGDFVWADFGFFAVTDTVYQKLAGRFKGFTSGSVEITQTLSTDKPVRNMEPRIQLPYKGPQLHELWITNRVHFDRRSTVRLIRRRECCGRHEYEVDGVEGQKSRWSAEQMDLVPVFTPRIAGKGLFVDKDELGSVDLFSFHEFPNWTICTDSVKLFIEENRFTNVMFLHYGEVV